jgi:transposase
MRYDPADCEWAAIKPMLPNKPRGVLRVNDRRVLNGIFWVLRSGAPWRKRLALTPLAIKYALEPVVVQDTDRYRMMREFCADPAVFVRSMLEA